MKRLHLLLIISISTASFAQAPEKRVNDTEVANDSVSTVTLDRSAHELKGVTVMGRLPMRVNENGALRYSGRLLIENRPVRNALDMLDEIPTLQRTGNQYAIIGATSFCILINGKKSGMSEEQLRNYLSSLPPERVANIDVYYNTPRRFGVRGASVNIVLSKARSHTLEMKGDLYGGLDQATYTSANSGINLSLSSARWSANMGYTGSYDNLIRKMELDASHLLKGHTYDVHQADRRRIRSFDNNMYADGDITLNEKSSLSLSYVLQEEHPKVSSTALTLFDGAPNPSGTHTKSPSWLHNLKVSFNRNELEVGINATFYNEKERQTLSESYESSLDGCYRQHVTKCGVYLDHQIRCLGGHINFGFRGDISTTTNDKDIYLTRDFTDGSSQFEQKEQSGSAYLGYRQPLGKKGFLNLSLEGEYFHSSYNKDGTSECTLWEQWHLYPSLTLVYRPRSRHVVQLTVNSEKYYPSYWTTAANRTYINAYCVSDGNTSLKPYVKYSCNLNYIIKSKYIFGMFAETSPDHFTQSMVLSDSELHAVYKYFNLNRDYRYGLMAVTPVDWTKTFQTQFTVMAFDMHQSGHIDDAISFSKSKVTSIFRINNHLSLFDKKLNLELSGWYQCPAIQGYYDVLAMYTASAGITWTPPVEGLSLSLKGEDLFGTYRMKTRCNVGKMKYAFCNDVDMQSFAFTVRYTFNGYKGHKKTSVDTSRFGL